MAHPPLLAYHHLRSYGYTPRIAWRARYALYRTMRDDDQLNLTDLCMAHADHGPILCAQLSVTGNVYLPVARP